MNAERKKQLEKLLRRLRQAEPTEKQQALLYRVKVRLLADKISCYPSREAWARAMYL